MPLLLVVVPVPLLPLDQHRADEICRDSVGLRKISVPRSPVRAALAAAYFDRTEGVVVDECTEPRHVERLRARCCHRAPTSTRLWLSVKVPLAPPIAKSPRGTGTDETSLVQRLRYSASDAQPAAHAGERQIAGRQGARPPAAKVPAATVVLSHVLKPDRVVVPGPTIVTL